MNTESKIRKMYTAWRTLNGNRAPNRAVVKMVWEDGNNCEKGWQYDTIALTRVPLNDDDAILFYASGLKGLLSLLKPNNGSDFVVLDVEEFYYQR